jgi:C4-dicarboxylate-specific signal transduction histidine kinase
MITEQYKHLGITLDLQLEQQIPQIVGNTYKFEQVIVNLLANAKDAVIERKNKDPEYDNMIVRIRSFRVGPSIIVEIEDNGIGISDDDLDNVILPFYTTKDEGKGTGLGLSICYQIIREMGGTIDIISNISSGTKIIVDLVIKKRK